MVSGIGSCLRLRGGVKRPHADIESGDSDNSDSFQRRKMPAPADSAGIRLMEKMGYTGGGLGAKGQGIHEAVKLDGNVEREGLGKTEKAHHKPRKDDFLFSDSSDIADAGMFGPGKFTNKRSREWRSRVQKALGKDSVRTRKGPEQVLNADDEDGIEQFAEKFDAKYGPQPQSAAEAERKLEDTKGDHRTDWKSFDRATRERSGLRGSGVAKQAVSSQERKKLQKKKQIFDLRERHRNNSSQHQGSAPNMYSKHFAEEVEVDEESGSEDEERGKQHVDGEFFDPTVPYLGGDGHHKSASSAIPERARPNAGKARQGESDKGTGVPKRVQVDLKTPQPSHAVGLPSSLAKVPGQSEAMYPSGREVMNKVDELMAARTAALASRVAERKRLLMESRASVPVNAQAGPAMPAQRPAAPQSAQAQATQAQSAQAHAAAGGNLPSKAAQRRQEAPIQVGGKGHSYAGPPTAGPRPMGLKARLQVQEEALGVDLTITPRQAPPVLPTHLPAPIPVPTVARPSPSRGGVVPAAAAVVVKTKRGRSEGGVVKGVAEAVVNFRDDPMEVNRLLDEPGGGWKEPKGGWERWSAAQVRAEEARTRAGTDGWQRFAAEAAAREAALPEPEAESQGWTVVGPGGLVPADISAPPEGSAPRAESGGIYPHDGWRPRVGYNPVDTRSVDVLRPAGQQELLRIVSARDRARARREEQRAAARQSERDNADGAASGSSFSFSDYMRYQAAIKAYVKADKRRRAFAVS